MIGTFRKSPIIKLSRITKYSILIFIAVLAFVIINKSGFLNPDAENIIASVGNSNLTESDLADFISNPEMDNYKLKVFAKNWIDREILAQSAINNNIVDNITINKNLQSYRRELLAGIYLKNKYRRIPFINEDEIVDFYNQNIENFVRDKKQIRAYHFLLDTRESANDLKGALISSDDEVKARLLNNYHGTLRTFGRDDVIEEISAAAFGSRREIVGPIQTEYGYHILQIIDRFDEESLIPLHEVKDEITQKIKIQKQNLLYFQLLDSLKLSVGYYLNENYFKNK